MTQTKLLYGTIILGVLAIVYMLGASVTQVKAGAPLGIPTTVATTSVFALSAATPARVFATSTCDARIISTSGLGGIMIGFSDAQGFVPSGAQGFWQGASTTVAYDSGQYGCGAVRVISGNAQVITVSESR